MKYPIGYALRDHGWMLFFITALSFIIRFAAWIYPGFGWGSLAIYDVPLYTQWGEEMVKAISEWNLREFASINVGVPPLGTLLTGVSAVAFRNLIPDYAAGLLAPIIASSASVPLIYLITRNFSRKAAVLASTIFALDPYFIQFSNAYLDSTGSFFLLIAMYFFITSEELSPKKSVLVGFFIMLSILTKFVFAVFAAFFVLLLILVKKEYRSAGIISAIAASSIALIPWIWFHDTLQAAVRHHTSINSLLPPIIFGPMSIGVPESYPWYFLTYFGMGQIRWKVLPSVSHLLLLFAFLYVVMKRKHSVSSNLMIFLAASVLSIVFIPRNYWTYVWGIGFARGEGVLFRQFYPYYFYLTNLAADVTACVLLFGKTPQVDAAKSGALVFPAVFYALTSPLVVAMNPLYPYWDFIFTLIMNFSRRNPTMGHYGFTALIITSIILLAILISAAIISNKLAKRGEKEGELAG